MIAPHHWFACEGDIAVLTNYTQVTKVDFKGCKGIEGNIQVLDSCPDVTSVNFQGCSNLEGEHTSKEIS